MNGSEARIGSKHSKILGDATGHFLAGSFILILGLWWSTKSILKYICKQQKRSSSLITPKFFSRAEILEGIVISVMALIAFIFYNHPRSNALLDKFLHHQLNLGAFLTGLAAFIEFLLTKNNVVLELLTSSFAMLQGACFLQIGFVLYPTNIEHAWDLNDPNNSMIFSTLFGAYYASIYVIIGVNYALVSWFIKLKLSKPCPSEIQSLKNYEQHEDSEDDM
ncbi:similar to Dermal papilla derived protein 7 (predicted), isoform CRA_a [Rattus norvegicus]|uniref:Similar to Dermal papilla derived protein 7 (Predicted), isoform CRA_a n=1 Tax=Rattus norvegicus TaxID=10116 RepID=A6IQN5_RAT|nr:similar to Dermal papilla derived protein 7 (predicted), isoform CRA_a [Rattus norvegicus]